MQDVLAGPLEAWFAAAVPGATEVRITGAATREALGHTSETRVVRVAWRNGSGAPEELKVIIRSAPTGPSLLEPFDLRKQYRVTAALQSTAVPVPRLLGFEEDPSVLGRPFYAMAHVSGLSFEREIPAFLRDGGVEDRRRLTDSVLRTLAHLHAADPAALDTGLPVDHRPWADREIDYWAERARLELRGPVPEVERLVGWLTDNRPPAPAREVLLHGDFKLSNMIFEGTEVAALLDWELADVGDPRADLAYLLVVNHLPDFDSPVRAAMSRAELVRSYEELTGVEVGDLTWFEVMVEFKLAAIYLRMSSLFRDRHTDDLRFLLGGRKAGAALARALARAGLEGRPLPAPWVEPARIAGAGRRLLEDTLLPIVADRADAAVAAKLLGAALATVEQGGEA